jgi:molecular chaperone GrpE
MTTPQESDTFDDDIVLEEEPQEQSQKKKLDKLGKVKEELKKCQEEKRQYLIELQKAKADFVNMRKRDEESQKEVLQFAAASLVEEIIPVLDSFTMAFSNKEQWEKVDPVWRTGVEYIHTQLLGILEGRGLQEISPEGEDFNPTLHEAVESVSGDAKDAGKVVEVLTKGYTLLGKVVRSAQVKVGQSAEKEA